MRRIRDRRPSTLFRGSELPRLLTLVVMLGVLFLLVGRARDPGMWRWFAPDAGTERPGAAKADRAQDNRDDVVAADPDARGPTDEDADQRDEAREEFEAVTDKAPLSKEEMPAYWRLMEWQQHQSLAPMRARAQHDVTFKQLWQQPEKWRGRLVEIPVHLRQTAKVEDLAENALGLKTLDEVWGWNTDSQPYWYWLVCPRLPPAMPSGRNIYEEATFVGYFLKLLPYEDHQGKTLATPLLIGRLVWHPAASNSLVGSDEWGWPWWLAAATIASLLVARWGLLKVIARKRAARGPTWQQSGDQQTVDSWLDHADQSDPHSDSLDHPRAGTNSPGNPK